jgi:hypothetical protein
VTILQTLVGPQSFTQSSLFVNPGGTLIDIGGILNFQSAITNDGTITNSGGGITNDGSIITNNADGTINYLSGDGTTNSGTIINNGFINFSGGTIHNFSDGTITNGGTITITDGATLDNGQGAITNSGTVTNGGTITNNGGTITNNSGGIINNGGVITNGINVLGGTITNSGIINNNNGATIANSGVINNGGTINNQCAGQLVGVGNVGGTINEILCVPILVSPSDGSTSSTSTPTFTWQDNLELRTNVQYEWQIAKASDPNTPIQIASPLSTTSHTANPLSSGTYVWKLRAVGASVPLGRTVIPSDFSATSSLTVLTPTQAAQNLITTIDGMNLPNGLTTSLTAKLNAAIASLNAGDCLSAKQSLNDLISQAMAQSGKMLTVAQANQLIAAAKNIINSLPC